MPWPTSCRLSRRLLPSTKISQVQWWMRLHEEVMGIADNLWNARRFGATLLVHLAATMQSHVSGAPVAGLRSKPDDFLVYYAGHDINICFLRRLLRINWLTESFNPNESPTGGMIQLELLSAPGTDGGKEYFVKAFFMSQSYDQQRNATALAGTPRAGAGAPSASRVFAAMPDCQSGPELSCPFARFKALVLAAVEPACVELVDPAVLRPTRRKFA